MARRGRALTSGEVEMLRAIYADRIDYARVRIHARRWFWPLPNNRAMAPNGHAYLPGAWAEEDYSRPAVPLVKRAVFVHEAAHLYQHYHLRWTVWLRGPFDRRYRYALVPGRGFDDYGLEQMGMIAQHYYTLLHGGRIGLPYPLAEYEVILPVR